MGIEAVYRKPHTSQRHSVVAHPGRTRHKIEGHLARTDAALPLTGEPVAIRFTILTSALAPSFVSLLQYASMPFSIRPYRRSHGHTQNTKALYP